MGLDCSSRERVRAQVISRMREEELDSWKDPPYPSLSLQKCMWKWMKEERLKVL